MAVVVLVAGLCLLALPGAARRAGRHLHPAEWSRLCVAALVAGAAAVELAAVSYGAPTVLRAVGASALADACERAMGLLLPGRGGVGWPAAAVAVALPVLTAVGATRGWRQQRAARIGPWLGQHRRFGCHELVVLPTDRLLAVSVAGPVSQIVVSRGLVGVLSPEEVAAVLHHEAAHLEHGHDQYLLVATALETSLGVLPFMRRSTAALRTGLERWADEAATGAEDGPPRRVLHRALLGVTVAMVDPDRAVAAFSAADTVIERLDALGGDPPRPSALRRSAVYLPGAAVSAAVLVAVGSWAGEVNHVLAFTSHCPT